MKYRPVNRNIKWLRSYGIEGDRKKYDEYLTKYIEKQNKIINKTNVPEYDWHRCFAADRRKQEAIKIKEMNLNGEL